MQQLEKGKLYQIYTHVGLTRKRGWIIAEYTGRVEAHTAHGYSISKGIEKRVWQEPAMLWFKGIRGGAYMIKERGAQVRDVTDETVAEIQRLREAIKQKGEEQQSLIKQLIGLCA